MGSKSDGVIGYKYYIGMHMALCHGPINAVQQIDVGDREAWSGTETGGTLTIDAKELFGGKEREGGISGDVDIDMGAADQPANAYLKNFFDNTTPALPTPGFRGVVSAVLNRVYIGLNPYLKNWAFKASRTTIDYKGDAVDWNASLVDINGAMNGAHIVRECLLAPDWGMGYPQNAIDDTSFSASASTLYDEGFGLCLQWLQQETIEDFIGLVLNHIGARLYVDARDGTFHLDLIRKDYTAASLPLFDETNIISVENYERRGWGETVNQISVVYTDLADREDKTVTLQNLANIQTQGRVVAETKNYPGLSNGALAARVAMRDLRISSSPMAKITLVVDRSAWDELPGGVFRFSWADYGISEKVFRIAAINSGTLTDGRISLEAVEDFFDLPADTYWAPQDTEWYSPNNDEGGGGPYPEPGDLAMLEMPYYEVMISATQAEIDALGADFAFMQCIGTHPTSTAYVYGGIALSSALTQSDASLAYRGVRSDTPYITITPALVKEVSSSAVFTDPRELFGGFGVDDGDNYFYTLDHPQITKPSWALIGDEIVAITNIISLGGTSTIYFDRGILDTVPEAHSAGSKMFFLDDWPISDKVEYANGQTVYAKLRGIFGDDLIPLANATWLSHALVGRAQMPYAPGKFLIDGSAWPASSTGDFTIAWAHRDRTAQLIPEYFFNQSYGNIGPEAAVTYNLTLVNNTQSVTILDETGLTGVSQSAVKAGVNDGAHLYWRVRVVATGQGDTGYYASFSELEMAATNGGTDQCVGGTATESTYLGSSTGDKAFDGLSGTGWNCSHASTQIKDKIEWVAYEFASAVIVTQLKMRAFYDAELYTPTAFILQYSDNGTDWTDALTVADEPTWSDYEERVYTLGVPGWDTGDSLTVTLESERDGVASWQKHEHTFVGN